MLVSRSQVDEVFERIQASPFLGIDCEATGLRVHHHDKLFSVIVAIEEEVFYFNFQPYVGLTDEFVLPLEVLARFNDLTKKVIFMANAKYDMHLLRKEGAYLTKHTIWDVLSIQKCLYNQDMKYGLADVAFKYQYEKLKTVEEYIKRHRLFTWEKQPGKKTRTKNPHFNKVPLALIQEYAERDGRITFDVGKKQWALVLETEALHKEAHFPSFEKVVLRECETTIACFKMECRGMEINREFINEAINYEQSNADAAAGRFLSLVGSPLVDSNLALSRAFNLLGISGGTTEKGNASFTDVVLAKINHPLAEAVRDYRDATKRANTYYKSFLAHADENGKVHANIRQTAADTFRFSITEPALQTLSKPSEDESTRPLFEVRDSFRARDGHFLVAIDYKQQEYRLTADYSGETALIQKIMAGEDVHAATAALMGVTRKQAKTLNFMLLYGGGIGKLCAALFGPRLSVELLTLIGRKHIYHYADWKFSAKEQALLSSISPEDLEHDLTLLKEAQTLKDKYFYALPKIEAFVDEVISTAKDRGYVFNYAGRRLHFPVKKFAYKAPNHVIQSSGAEIMRAALIELEAFLEPYKSNIILPIHDEILFEMSEDELYLIPELRRIMVSVYTPRNGCFMDTSVAMGKTWGSLQEAA